MDSNKPTGKDAEKAASDKNGDEKGPIKVMKRPDNSSTEPPQSDQGNGPGPVWQAEPIRVLLR